MIDKIMTDKILETISFAIIAHGDQKRKYTNLPYVTHCLDVAKTCMEAGMSTECIQAAILHDVVEDTPLDISHLKERFGTKVSYLVWELTDQYTKEAYPHFNRAERKKLERERLGKISDEAKGIKLADLIDNTTSIVQYDPGFAKVYLKEKEAILEALSDCSYKDLYERAKVNVGANEDDLYREALRATCTLCIMKGRCVCGELDPMDEDEGEWNDEDPNQLDKCPTCGDIEGSVNPCCANYDPLNYKNCGYG